MEVDSVISFHNLTSHSLSTETNIRLFAHPAYGLLPRTKKIEMRKKKITKDKSKKKREQNLLFTESVIGTQLL